MALNYVGYQAWTVEQVRRKLHEKGYGADITDDSVQCLTDYGYLDDEAYAKASSPLPLARSGREHLNPVSTSRARRRGKRRKAGITKTLVGG